jgi:DNA processing protein
VRSERDLLVEFCSSYEVSPAIAAQVLEHGIDKVIANSRLMSRCLPLPAATHKSQAAAITYLDSAYPKCLFDLAEELPLVLWYRSNQLKFNFPRFRVSIIGSNQPSLTDVRLLGNLLAQTYLNFLPITDASMGVGELLLILSTVNQFPIAIVAASGTSKYSLPLNWRQRRKFLGQGLILSETPPHLALNRDRLLRRNRVIAAMSDAVIAIRPAKNSGASSILHWADQLGREIHLI